MPRRAAAVTAAASAAEEKSDVASVNQFDPPLPRFEKQSLFALHSCGRSTRKLRNAIAKLDDATVTRSADLWTPKTTHLVLPILSRNVKIVCALAGGGQLARPNFVDLIAELKYVPADVPLEYGWDLSKEVAPRYHHDAANVWRRRRAAGHGGVLRGLSVFIVGELVPKRARGADGLISTTMAQAILVSADAVVSSTPEEADFALVTDVEIEKKHPAIQKLRDASIPCFGPAILTDLIRRVEIKPPEFLAFKDQADLCEELVTANDAENADIVPILVHRPSSTTATDETLVVQRTSSPRRKPKATASAKKSPSVPDRKLPHKPRGRVSPKIRISKRRSKVNSRIPTEEKDVTRNERKTNPAVDSSGKHANEVIQASPNGKRSVSAVEPVNLKLRIKRPRRASSDYTVEQQRNSELLSSSCVARISVPSMPITSSVELLTPVSDRRQLEVSAVIDEPRLREPDTELRKPALVSTEARHATLPSSAVDAPLSSGDGPTPEPPASQPDPVSLLLSLAKSPASAPTPPAFNHLTNNPPISLTGSIARPVFSHAASPQLPIRSQFGPTMPSVPSLPQAGLSRFVLPSPSSTLLNSPAVARIGLSPIGPLSLPPLSANNSANIVGSSGALVTLPTDVITNNGTPSTLFSPGPNRQRGGSSDLANLLAPMVTTQVPSLVNPTCAPDDGQSTCSPKKRKSVALEHRSLTDGSPATPENLNGSPLKRRRANGNGGAKISPPLDFRLAHDARKAPSQTQNEPDVAGSGSASTVKPPTAVAQEEDMFGDSACVVRDNVVDLTVDSCDTTNKKQVVTAAQTSEHKAFVVSLLEDVLNMSCARVLNSNVEVIVLDSETRDEAQSKAKEKKNSPEVSGNVSFGNESSSESVMKPSQVRKRPRRVIRESPPSDDDEDENNESSSFKMRGVNESQSSVPTKSSAEVHETQAVSTGSLKSGDQGLVRSNRVDAQPNRRRVQLRTPENNAARSRLDIGGDAINSKVMNELTAIATGQFGKVPSVEDGYKDIVDWIGGEVSEGQLEQFAPTREDQHVKKPKAGGKATNARKRPRGRETNTAIYEESPPDNGDGQNSNDTIDMVNVDNEVVEVREVDRPLRTQGHSRNVTSGRTDALFDAFDRPKGVTVPIQTIPGHIAFLNRCSVNLDLALGVGEDDKRLVQETVQFKDWLYSAEHLELDDEARDCLQNRDASDVMDVAHSCVRSMQEANVLRHLAVSSEVDMSRLRSVVGICARFLGGKQTKDLVAYFLELLLKARELQQAKGQDSLLYMLSKSSGSSRVKHEFLQFIWVSLVDACRRFSGHNPNSIFWALFNEKWFGNPVRMPILGKNSSSYEIVDASTDKLFDSLRTISCLFAFSFNPPDPTSDMSIIFSPNWQALNNVLDSIVARTYDSIDDHRKVLSSFLVKICTQFADKLWKVDDKFVVQVLSAVKTLCAKYDQPCSCTKVHTFLTQFNSIGDLRARRRSVQDYLQTDCECASFLAWVSVAQEEVMSSKLSGKILQHNSQFIRAKGVVKEPPRALTHHLGLILAISDCIVKSQGGSENLLKSMLFSKAPSVARAVENPLNFDTRIVESWTAVLETVSLRCRHLLASGYSLHVYSDYIFENMYTTLQCIERPESAKPLSVEDREAKRVLQAVLVKLMVKMLSGFANIVKLVVQHVDGGQYSNFEAVESLLVSLSKFVKRLGKFSVGLISIIRSGNSRGSTLSRQEVLLAIISFVEQGLALCTVRARQRKRISAQESALVHQNHSFPSPGCDAFSKLVQSEMLESFVNMVQSPVFESAPKQDMDVRLSASRALARTVGLCCIGPDSVYSVQNSHKLVDVIRRAKMSVLGFANGPAIGTLSVAGSIADDEQSRMKLELLMQTEFWSIVLDDAWSSAVLSLNESFQEVVFGLWIILLVVSYAESKESELAKAVPMLSYGIQKAARLNANLAKWFKETCQGQESNGMNSMVQPETELNMLDPKIRLETLVGSFSVVLNSWTSAKVQNLVKFIRQYIGLSSKNMIRKYEAFNASQNHWRTSRDVSDGKMALLHAQVLAVLFVVHVSLSVPTPQFRGRRPGSENSITCTYMSEITESVLKAMNKLRKNGNDEALAHIQLLVVTALAIHSRGLDDVQTRVIFVRFLRLCGDMESLGNLVTWNDLSKVPKFMRCAPFSTNPKKARSDKEREKLMGIQKRSRKVREMALSTLVEQPMSRKTGDTLEFRVALEQFCGLLRRKETIANLRETGLWPNVCQVVAIVGKRGDVTQREMVWEALKSEIQDAEAAYLKTSLRKAG